MAISKKTWIIIGIVAFVIILSIVIYASTRKPKVETGIKGAVPLNPASATAAMNLAGIFKPETWPLAIYMKGANCLRLQKLLNYKGYTPKLVEDGYFGSKTEAALLSIYSTKTATEDQLNQWEKFNYSTTSVSPTGIPALSAADTTNVNTGIYQPLVTA